jgi:AAA+ ATPase superfamily predicted ATPase
MKNASSLGWLTDLAIEPSLIQTGPLAIMVEGTNGDDLPRFLRNLLALKMGRSDWSDSAREYLTRGDFSRACKLMECTPPEARNTLQDEVTQAWQRHLVTLRTAMGDVRSGIRELEIARIHTSIVIDWLSLAEEATAKLPSGSGQSLYQALSCMDSHELRDAHGYLAEASRAVEHGRTEFLQRRDENLQRVRDLKHEATQLADDLLLRSDLPGQAIDSVMKIQTELVSAFRRQDVPTMEALLDTLKQIEHGRYSVEIPAGANTSESAPLNDALSRTVEYRSAVAGAPLRKDELSDWVQAVLRNIQNSPAFAAQVEPDDLPLVVLREWDGVQLDAISRRAAAIEKRGEANAELALGVFLAAEGKSRLLEGDAEGAQAFFLDAFRWSATPPPNLPQHERWRDNCAWGVLLGLTVPYLPTTERRQTLAPANLLALFQRRIGDIPLARIDQLQLFEELAYIAVRMGLPHAQTFLAGYLRSYLTDRPLAAQEFARGIVLEAAERWPVALVLLADLFRDLDSLPKLAADLAGMAHELRSRPRLESLKQTAEIVERVRRKITGAADRSELAAQVEDALNSLERRRQAHPVEPGTVLNNRLLTPNLTLKPGERLILEVHNRDPIRPIRNLRTEVSVLDGSDRSIAGVFAAPDLVPRVPSDERREIVLGLARTDSELCNATKILVRYSTRDVSGKYLYIEPNFSSFTIRVSMPAEPPIGLPLNPYVVGKAVQHRDGIFGRDEQINGICRALMGEKQDNAVLVLGERRMGKTTVLNAVALHQDIVDRYHDHVVRLDVEDVPATELAADFFRNRLIDRIVSRLVPLGIRLPVVSETRLKQNPYQTFKDFMEDLDDSLKTRRRRVLIILDELEKLLSVVEEHPSPTNGTLGMETIAALRAVILHSKHISFILAGVTDVLRRHTVRHDNRLFRLAIEIELKRLPDADARRLVQEPARPSYQIEAPARDMIVEETNGHPYLLQYVCRELFEQMLARGTKVAARTDIEDVLTTRILPKADAFQHLVEAVPDTTDSRLVNALAALQIGNRTVPVGALYRQLARTGSVIAEEEISARLLKLRERAPMLIDDSTTFTRRFRLAVGLFARRLRLLQEERRGLVVREAHAAH